MLKRLTPDVVMYLMIAWLSAEFVFLGKFSTVSAGDNGEVILPGLISSGLSDSVLHFWDRFSAAGSDRFSEGWHGLVDIWLFKFFPGWLAYQLRVVTLVAVPILSIRYLSERVLKLDGWSSLYIAIAMSLLINPGVLLQSSLGYIPGAIAVLTWLMAKKLSWVRWVAAAATLIFVTQTAYFSQLVPFASAIVFLWFLCIDVRKSVSSWAIILFSVLAINAARLVDFAAMVVVAPQSHISLVRIDRSFQSIMAELLTQPIFLSNALMVLCTALFVYGITRRRLHGKDIKGVLIVFLLALSGPPLGTALQAILVDTVPQIRGYNFTRFNIVIQFFLIIGAGYGFHALLLQFREGRQMIYRSALVVCVGALLWQSAQYKVANVGDWITQGGYVHNFDSPVLAELAENLKDKPIPERAETFQVYPRYLHNYGIETAGGYQALVFKRYFEFWDRVLDPWLQQLDNGGQTRWKDSAGNTFVNTGERNSYRSWRLQIVPPGHRTEVNIGNWVNMKLLALANVGYFISRDKLLDQNLELISGPERSWSSLPRREKIWTNFKANFHGREHLFVYRNKSVLPRVFSVQRLEMHETSAQVLDRLSSMDLNELKTTMVASRDDVPERLRRAKPFSPLDHSVKEYTDDRIVLEVKSEGDSLLFVGNSFSPQWSARIDGARATLFPANHAFWGIPVPQGARKIEFQYLPFSQGTKQRSVRG